jgi:hypothetical protein
MKKITMLISLIILLSMLAACGTAAQEESAQTALQEGVQAGASQEGAEVGSIKNSAQSAGEESQSGVQGERSTSIAIQLALGTFMLEETDYPIDSEQAAQLVSLWKAARSLNQNETTATQELDAVMRQIQNTMTPEQMGAIEDMELSFQDMGTIAEDMGLDFGGAGRFGDLTPEMQATMQAARESGQATGSGFGGGQGGIPGQGGGPGGGGGSGLSPEARETAIAARGDLSRATLGLPANLLDAVIEFLEARVD